MFRINTHRFLASLLILALSPAARLARADSFAPESFVEFQTLLDTPSLVLGQSLDIDRLNDSLPWPCFEYDSIDPGTQALEISKKKLFSFHSEEAIRREARFTIEVAASGPFWSIDTGYYDDVVFEQSQDSLVVEVNAYLRYTPEKLVNPRLTEWAQNLRLSNPEVFRQYCGTHLVDQHKRGSAVAIRYIYRNLEQSERDALIVCADLAYGSVEAQTCFDHVNAQLSRLSSASLEVFTIGMSPVQAANVDNGIRANPYDPLFVAQVLDREFFQQAQYQHAVPIAFSATPIPELVPDDNLRLRQAYMQDYFTLFARVDTMAKRIDEILADAQECMTRNLDNEARELLLDQRAFLKYDFLPVIVQDSIECWNADLWQEDPLHPDHVLQACTPSEDYQRMERELDENPIQWPVDLILPSQFTFCQWCNRVDSTSLDQATRRTIRAMIESSGYDPSSYRCIESEDTLLNRQVINLDRTGASNMNIVGSLGMTRDSEGNQLYRLKELMLHSNDIRHLEGLEHLKQVEILNLYGNPLSSIRQVAELPNLRRLIVMGGDDYYGNRIFINLSDWTPIRELRYLEELRVGLSNFSDAGLLLGKPLLTQLSLRDSQVSDLTPLADHSLLLKNLWVQYTPQLNNDGALALLDRTIRDNIANDAYFKQRDPGSLLNVLLADPVLLQRWIPLAKAYFGEATNSGLIQKLALTYRSVPCNYEGMLRGGHLEIAEPGDNRSCEQVAAVYWKTDPCQRIIDLTASIGPCSN